ncbi:MAG: TatD family hydrolase [Rhodothermaceae bacterium]
MNIFIDIHTHNNDSDLSIVNLFLQEINFSLPKEKLISAGIHPWHISEINLQSELEKLFQLAESGEICAIGEIGLDLLTKSSLPEQKKIFEQQLEIAEKFQLPVIIHCVKAFNEIVSIRKKRSNQTNWIIHGFNNNLQIAKELIKHKCFISFGAALLKNNSNASNIIKEIPLQNIFLETDESENKIEEIYNKAAELLNIETKELQQKIRENFTRCFGKDYYELVNQNRTFDGK